MTMLLRLFRALCLFCLGLIVLGALALYAPFWFGLCTPGTGGAVSCAPPAARTAYELGFTIVALAVQLFVPAALAAIGVFILVYERLRPAPPRA